MEKKTIVSVIDKAEIRKPLEELQSEAFKLYEKLRLYDSVDKKKLRKFLLEVFYVV